MKHLLGSATICTYQRTYLPFELRNATSCGRDMSHESAMSHGNMYVPRLEKVFAKRI